MITVPFLVFLVLGYDLDLRNKKLINSLDVTVESWPIGASIYNFDQDINLKTPTNLKTVAGSFLDLQIKKENFVSERIGIYGPVDTNTRINLPNLWLLPSVSQNIAKLNDPKNQATGQKLKENIQILPEIILWTEKAPNLAPNSTNNSVSVPSLISNLFSSQSLAQSSVNNSGDSQKEKTENLTDNLINSSTLWIQNYSINGLGVPEKVLQKTTKKIDFSKSPNEKNPDNNWENIGQDSFWNKENSWLLFRAEKWYFYDLSDFALINLVRVSNWQFLALQNKTLWLFDLEKSPNITANLNTFAISEPNSQSTNSQVNSFQNSQNNSSISSFNNSASNPAAINSNPFSIFDKNPTTKSSENFNSSESSVEKAPKSQFSRQFLESEVNQITISNNSVWIWQGSQIFRVNTGRIDNWNPSFFGQNLKISQKCCKFKNHSFLQGNLFLLGKRLWFLPDSDKTKWTLIADNVLNFESFEEVIFWQDLDGFLQVYNFITKSDKFLGQIPIEKSSNSLSAVPNLTPNGIYYDQNLRRLFIYGQEVWSIWFDKTNPNANNLVYYPTKWLKQPCVSKIQDRLQFCLQSDILITYGNFNFF